MQHRSVIFRWLLGGLLTGLAGGSLFFVGPTILWLMALIGGVLLLIRRPRTALAGLFILATIIGVRRSQSVLSVPSAVWDMAAGKPTVTLAGYVDGDFSPTANGGQYTFKVVRINGLAADDRIVVFGPATVRPLYGQVYELTGKLQRPNSDGDFDYASYLAKNGVHAMMYYPQYSVPLDWWPSGYLSLQLAVVGRLHGVRDAVAQSVGRSVRQPEAAYLAGILVGAQGIVPADIKEMFSRTGTSHILALSGYNITVIIGVLTYLLAPLGRRRSFWFALAGIVAFTLAVGATPSVGRAAIMGVLLLAASQMGRPADAGVLVMLSAVVMCWLNPLLLRWDVGFQLSFLALLGIIYIEPLVKPLLEKMLRWPWLAAVMATTASASLMVTPLLLYNFGQLAVYTLPVNAIVLPLVPLAMALGFTTAIAGFLVPVLGQVFGQIAWLVATFQLGVIRLFSGLPYAAIELRITWVALLSAYAAIAAWLIFEYRRRGTNPNNQR